ncbi:MAG: GcvT family protein [Rhodospirillales bacterium]
MSADLPAEAEVVIVGGGVIGASIAYHLPKIGVTDVVLLERRQLTSGTTWHAAGLVGQLRDNRNMTMLAKYTAELYSGLADETGQPTGFKQNGSLSTATNPGRLEDLHRRAEMAKAFDLRVDKLTAQECKSMYPLLNVEDVIGGIFIPSDGQANPVDVTQALVKGARMGGAQIFENTPVVKLLTDRGRMTGVETDKGVIKAKTVVLACGMWTRELAKTVGAAVPLHACEHFYIVTEPFEGVTDNLPVYRDYDACAYYKEDAGKILLGAFEPVAKPWGMDGIPEDFEFTELPDDFDHFEPILEGAIHRMPALETAGVQKFFCGPESFTPDDRYHLGPAPEVEGLMIAAGFNSIGIQSAGGAGKVMSEWIKHGHPPMDFVDVDVRRNAPFQANAKYLHDRVTETLGLLYAVHWPYYQYTTARGARRSALHEQLKSRRAVFGETLGWERPNWFADEGQKAEYEYAFGRQNWFENHKREHMAAREGAALFDQCHFAKFLVQGPDAEKVLNRISANDMSVAPGKIVYTPWLNERAGFEADLTVTRLDDAAYMVITGTAAHYRDLNWLKAHVGEDDRCAVTDVTSGTAMLAVMGPKARDVLAPLTSADLSNEAFPFGTSQQIEIGYAMARASRITYVGELGWELTIPAEFAPGVFDVIMQAGEAHGLRLAGYHALNSLRLEKAFKHWGHDMADEDTPYEIGLGFACKLDKPGGFIGRDALARAKDAGTKKRLVQFVLNDPEPMLYHNEPIYRDGAVCGYVTSAMYGHALGGATALGWVENTENPEGGVDADYVKAGRYEIEICGARYSARASLRPMYDPKSERVKV